MSTVLGSPHYIDSPFGHARVHETGAVVKGSHWQLHDWANRPGAAWPCSTLTDVGSPSVTAVFDARGDLVEIAGPLGKVDSSELSAWVDDVLAFGPSPDPMTGRENA